MKNRLKKALARAKRYANQAVDYICKHPIKSTMLLLFPLFVLVIIIKLTLWIIRLASQAAAAIGAFFDVYFIPIVTICLVLWWFLDRYSKRRQESAAQKLQREEQERARQVQEYEATKEATYQTEAKVLFAVSQELSEAGIKPPTRLSNLYSPMRTIPKAGGAFTLCQYLLQKSNEVVNTEDIKTTLQTKIDQRLSAGDFPDIDPQHIYNGRVYSGFVVESIRDTTGFIEVYTVLTNDEYCRWKQDLNLRRDTLPPDPDRRDIRY